MLKNLSQIFKQNLIKEKSSYFILTFVFAILTVLLSWYIQFKIHNEILNGKSLYLLMAMLMIAWLPFWIAVILLKIFKFPFQMFLLIPLIGKKLIWTILVPCLAAAIGIKFSLIFSQISMRSQDASFIANGDTVFGVLNLYFLGYFPALLFCAVVSVGNELVYRAFFIESCLRAGIRIPWFFAGMIQFIAFTPFLWFGYFGGGEGNFTYLICWFLLFVFLSAFQYWLSLSSMGECKGQGNKTPKILAKRSLVQPIIAASTFHIIYFVVAARFLTENGNLWMSGPANVITIVIYFIITIFLLMTKRLKY